ncbi:MAG: ATP synthase F1 subunit gamma [Chloroflexi bacterium]|nr:ATP synthase F1 subunit gamma [Chloroflexota bacterium]
MPTARDIRRRMTSVGNIRQITRAMELIAVTRLRRAQQRVLASRPYSDKMRQVLADLVERVTLRSDEEVDEFEVQHPLLERRPVRRVAVILLTTDRGLCGALNSSTIRAALQFTFEQQNQGRTVEFIAVGRKGVQSLRRHVLPVVAEFAALGDYPNITRVTPISRVAMDAFTGRQYDDVVLVYPRFVSTLRQEPAVVPLLPIQPPETAGRHAKTATEYIYEPDPASVLAGLLPRYVEIQMYQAVLEMIASEFSARMVAMRNATDNATELVNELRLGLNKTRQATITREIIEVSAGAQAGA